MADIGSCASRRRTRYAWPAASAVGAGAVAAATVALLVATQAPALAATAPGLGTAGSFGVLAATTVTNTGPSIISGNLGVSPGSAVTGFPPGMVILPGTVHKADAVAGTAQADLTTAYNNAAGQSPTVNIPPTIGSAGSLTAPLVPGVYKASSSLEVKGALTLDAGGDPNAVWIFQAPSSTLITDSASSVVLINGAQACNVFWQVGSSATLGTHSTFQGNILALTSITVNTGDTITGRALARNGAVTLDDDRITVPACTTTTPPPTTTPPTTTPPTTTPPTTTPPTTTPPTTTPPTPPVIIPGPRPTGPGQRPTGPGQRPTGPGQRPTSPGQRPTSPGQRPTSPGQTPTSPGQRPTSPGQTPTSPGQTPTSPGQTPTSPAPRPPTPAPAPTPVSTPFPVTG